jgi:prolyl oligopeptidase
MPTINYPDTKRSDVTEKQFRDTIADPYRWLENDGRRDRDVAAWVETGHNGDHA